MAENDDGFRGYLQKVRKKNGEKLTESTVQEYAESIGRYLPRLNECKDDAALLECMNAIVKRTRSIVAYSALSHYLDYLGKAELKQVAMLQIREGKVLLKKNLEAPPQRAVSARSKRMLQSKVLSIEEMRKLLTEPKGLRTRCLFSVLYDTACRSSEVVENRKLGLPGMRIADITLMTKEKNAEERRKGIYAEVRVLGKGRKYRTVYLGRHSVMLIRQMLKERKRQPIKKKDNLFEFYKDEAETKKYPNQTSAMYHLVVKECARILGRHIHPHIFRHTKASHMAEGGASPIELMDYLGHDNIATTMIYVEVSKNKSKKTFENFHKEICMT